MTTIQIKLEPQYVDPLLAVIASQKEIPIDDITIQNPSKLINACSKAKLLKIAQECAVLPSMDHRSAEQILGYEGDAIGLWSGS